MSIDYSEVSSVADRAIELARQHHHEMATLEHVLIAILEKDYVIEFLTNAKVNIVDLQDALDTFMEASMISPSRREPSQSLHFDFLFRYVIGKTKFSSRKSFNALDVLLRLIQFPHEDSFAVTALLRSGLTSLQLKKHLSGGSVKSPDLDGMGGEQDITTKEEAVQYLAKYCSNLNEIAAAGSIDPLIGRAIEVANIIQVLARRTKNNVVLVGQAGVGKTSICEGLALKIVEDDVPDVLKGSTVYVLDLGLLIAGAKFRGDVEERVALILKSLGMIEKSILFIDEIHMIMDAGTGTKGSMDVANLLKPALAKGKLRCIGSTTDEEYRKHFEKDRALLRRFKKVVIDEPSPEVTKMILRGLKKVYEEFHSVVYTTEALDAAVDLSHKYITNALLPDKAIDLIDNAGACQRVADPEARLEIIDVRQIEQEISKVTKIPEKEIVEAESDSMERLEDDLRSQVFGQDKAITKLTDAVFVSRAGLRSLKKPAGSYLFVGPSGCGKTETSKQLAKTLGIPLIKFDMSEYVESHSVSKLIGAPPGYIGYGDGDAGTGVLTNAVDKSPSCVLLLDEIEKAHPDIFNILLQVMDDASLTNSSGKTIDFRNVILIMTSNVGVSTMEKNPLGFGNSEPENVDDKAIKQMFRPEFRNRLDAIVKFDKLKPEHMIRIVEKFLAELSELCQNRNVLLSVDEKTKAFLAKEGYDPSMGARPLARVINETIKVPLSKLMVTGSLKNGGNVEVIFEDEQIKIRN